MLLLQEFTFIIHVQPGKKHTNADHLSRLTNVLGGDPIPDSFPDVDLLVVDVNSKEYADLIQYLIHHTFPPHFTDRMKT